MKNKNYFKHFYVITLIISQILTFNIYAKNNKRIVHFSADSLEYEKTGLKNINKLRGNVVFEKKGLKITAEQADYEEQKKIEAKGNIVIEKTRDDNTIIKILSNSLSYDVEKEIAQFYEDVTLIDGENVLTSNSGEYKDSEDIATFIGNVQIKNKEQIVRCDLLSYENINKDILKLHQDLFADLKIDIKKKKKIYNAEGSVNIFIPKEKIEIKSNYFIYYKENERSKLFGKPILKKIIKKEVYYLYSDKILIHKDENSKDDEHKQLKAIGKVCLYNKELKAKSNEVLYVPSKSTIYFGVNSIFWSGSSQLTSDDAKIFLENEELKEMHLANRALIIQKDEFKNFNQIKGELMKMYFKKNKIKYMVVEKEAQSIQFLSDKKEKALIGINHIKSDKIKIDFKNNKAQKVSFLGKNKANKIGGLMMAPKEATPQTMTFRGFNWRPDEQPNIEEVNELMNNR